MKHFRLIALCVILAMFTATAYAAVTTNPKELRVSNVHYKGRGPLPDDPYYGRYEIAGTLRNAGSVGYDSVIITISVFYKGAKLETMRYALLQSVQPGDSCVWSASPELVMSSDDLRRKVYTVRIDKVEGVTD